MAYFLMIATHFLLERTKGLNVTLCVFYWGIKLLMDEGSNSQHR